jgi:hypothetical protein
MQHSMLTNRLRSAACLAATLALAVGCQRDDLAPLGNDAPAPPLTVGLEVSSPTARVGDRIALAVRASANLDEKLQGIQGYVRFNPAYLTYAGQAAGLKTLVTVNESKASQGELRFLGVEPRGLDARTATLVFEVKHPDYVRGLSFQFEAAATFHNEIYKAVVSPKVAAVSDLAIPKTEHLTGAMWVARVAPGEKIAPVLLALAKDPSGKSLGPSFTAGQYVANLKYGDAADGNGTINVSDVAYLSNIAVGSLALFDGGAALHDAVIAGNVRPINGGTGGTPRPGLDASGGPGVIDVSDVSAVSNRAVGATVAVVGDVIPGRGSSNPDGTGKPRVVITADITTNTTWTKDNVYQIGSAASENITNGNDFNVRNNATLTIQPGTRIEGWPGNGTFGAGGVGVGQGTLNIARDGRIVADGTALEPIVMTCVLPPFAGPLGQPANTRWSGCWGGLIINGNATINADSPTSGSNPANGSRSTAGCIQEQDESNAATLYGGCNDGDDSGILRYVRVEFPGARFTANKERNGITFNGVGSGTIVDNIQVHSSLDDGVEFFGGTVQLKHVYLTGNEDDMFDWVLGFRGKAQFVLAQADSTNSDRCMEMDNNGIDAGDPDRTPRSNPIIYNVTCVGKQAPAKSLTIGPTCLAQNGGANCVTQGMLFRQNTAGTVRNSIIYRYGRGIDFDQPSGAAGGGLTLSPTGLCTQLSDGDAGTIGTGLTPRNILISIGAVPSAGGVGVAGDDDGNDPGVASGVPGDCGPYTTAGGFTGSNLEALYIAKASNAITVFASGDANGDYLVDPLNVLTPDFRPKTGSAPATAARSALPGGGFFETADYIGAVAPANGQKSNIPWYVGWTRGWTTSTTK